MNSTLTGACNKAPAEETLSPNNHPKCPVVGRAGGNTPRLLLLHGPRQSEGSQMRKTRPVTFVCVWSDGWMGVRWIVGATLRAETPGRLDQTSTPSPNWSRRRLHGSRHVHPPHRHRETTTITPERHGPVADFDRVPPDPRTSRALHIHTRERIAFAQRPPHMRCNLRA